MSNDRCRVVRLEEDCAGFCWWALLSVGLWVQITPDDLVRIGSLPTYELARDRDGWTTRPIGALEQAEILLGLA